MTIIEKCTLLSSATNENRDIEFTDVVTTGCVLKNVEDHGQIDPGIDQNEERISIRVNRTPTTVNNTYDHVRFRGNVYQLARSVQPNNLELILDLTRKI